EGGLTGNEGFTVYGYSGSVAEDYVNNINDIIRSGDKLKFVALDSAKPDVPDVPETPDTPDTPDVPSVPDTPDVSADWKKAYTDFLKNGSYQEFLNGSYTPKFAVAYIDGDDIPELAVADGDYHAVGVALFTYKDGEVVPLYSKNYSDDTELAIYGGNGRVDYSEKNNLICSNYTSTGEGYYGFYNINDDKTINTECMFNTSDHNNTMQYLINGQEVTASEYDMELLKYNNRINAHISYSENMFEITDENIRLYIDSAVSGNVTSGKCGDNAYWTLDKSAGILTISGTGDIYNYGDWAYEEQSPPWCTGSDYGSYIKTIIIEEGITGIGVYNFYGSAVSSVKLPESLKKIDMLAFHDCENLKKITIPKNVTEIGDRAFGQYGNSGLGIADGFVVYGYKGSVAEKYVNDANNIINTTGKLKFVAVQDYSGNTDNSSVSENNSPVNTSTVNTSSGNTSSAGKSAPATGDNINKIFSSLVIAGFGVSLFRKRNRKNNPED
ncbi:MAG: leucine-rich repeat protein, partial [Ruminococcus sp.]|nr:leucine-rich repeat protein [Ruminococcus sp.]